MKVIILLLDFSTLYYLIRAYTIIDLPGKFFPLLLFHPILLLILLHIQSYTFIRIYEKFPPYTTIMSYTIIHFPKFFYPILLFGPILVLRSVEYIDRLRSIKV